MRPEDESERPAAYDPEGRPLYYHPAPTGSGETTQYTPDRPTTTSKQTVERSSHVTSKPDKIEGQNFHPKIRSQYANEPRVVHAGRPLEPQQFTISEELARKHQASNRRYPGLSLSTGEFVILDIKRHPIGMIIPLSATALLILAIMMFVATYPNLLSAGLADYLPSPLVVFVIGILLSIITVIGGAIVLWVYLRNRFFMTNESIIQEVQETIFSYVEQSVSLGSIEDASFRQSGVLPTLLNYGTVHLTVERDESKYVFRYVRDPKRQIAIINNAIESFKNGRPVEDIN